MYKSLSTLQQLAFREVRQAHELEVIALCTKYGLKPYTKSEPTFIKSIYLQDFVKFCGKNGYYAVTAQVIDAFCKEFELFEDNKPSLLCELTV